MGYIYRYIDLEDNIIKYVGIVWSKNRTLEHRIRDHELNDSWCWDKKWKIEYITENINTRTDAEYLESHYISLYGTSKYYNIKKKDWGISSFISDKEQEWKEYKVIKSDKAKNEKQISKLEVFANMIKDKLRTLSYAVDLLYSIENNWKDDCENGNKISKKEMYNYGKNTIRRCIYDIDCIANDYDISFEERVLERYMNKNTARKAYEYFNECKMIL